MARARLAPKTHRQRCGGAAGRPPPRVRAAAPLARSLALRCGHLCRSLLVVGPTTKSRRPPPLLSVCTPVISACTRNVRHTRTRSHRRNTLCKRAAIVCSHMLSAQKEHKIMCLGRVGMCKCYATNAPTACGQQFFHSQAHTFHPYMCNCARLDYMQVFCI